MLSQLESQIFINDELFATLPFTVGLSEFVNEVLGFKLTHPSGWTIDQSNPLSIEMTADASPHTVVVVTILSGPVTLDTMASQFAEAFESVGLNEVSRTRLDDEVPGYMMEFELSVNDTSLLIDVLIKVSGARTFLVTSVGAESTLNLARGDADRVLESFTIVLPVSQDSSNSIDVTADSDELLASLENQVLAIRELSSETEVKYNFQEREDFVSELQDEELDEESIQDIAVLKDFCLVLDLCQESDDLLDASTDLTSTGVLGYYDIEDKILTVVSDDEDNIGLEDWLTYAHEYTHAIQDQHFDISTLTSDDDNSDFSWAVSALIEGDANLVEALFYESLSPEQQAQIAILREKSAEEFSESSEVTDAPRIFSETFGWQHSEGLNFAFRLYLDDGFDAIDTAYENLPEGEVKAL